MRLLPSCAAIGATTLAAACSLATRPAGPAQDTSPAAVAMRGGLATADRFRVDAIADRRFTHASYWRAIEPTTRASAFRVEEIGQSIQGRAIRSVTFGSGPVKVLLWSQMHGDESTASMSLADIFRFLAESEGDPLRERLRRELTIVFVPMLHPAGAELFQRENALGVDVNRDARRLSTPEARALKSLHERLQPDFGFNLHDQGARTRVGPRGGQAAIALLAPAFDASRSYNDVRGRARLVAATMAEILAHGIPGGVAKYDDSFNPRAFGDLMQTWGTSTVLIESGAMRDDPQKQQLRKVNVAAILGALDAIATRRYADADPASYENLPYNSGGASDLLVRGGRVVLPGKPAMLADLAINYDDAVARTGGRIREVGDLEGVIAIDTVDVTGLFLHPAGTSLTARSAAQWLTLGSPATFEVRRGADPSSALVRRIGPNAR